MTKKFLGWSSVAASLVVAGVAAVGTANAAPTWTGENLVVDGDSKIAVHNAPLTADTTASISGADSVLTPSASNQFITTTGVYAYTLDVTGTGKYTISGFGISTGSFDGGAIHTADAFTLGSATSKGTLTFSGNTATASGNGNRADGGAICSMGMLTIAGGTNIFDTNKALKTLCRHKYGLRRCLAKRGRH